MVVMVAIMTIMMVVIIILSNMVMMVMKIIFSIMMMVIIVVMAIIFMVHVRITYSSRRASIAAAWVTAGSSVRSISRIAADSSMYAVIWVALHAIARVASIHAIARIACALHAIARVANTKALIMTKTRSAIHMSCISHIHSLLHIGYSPEYENIL